MIDSRELGIKIISVSKEHKKLIGNLACKFGLSGSGHKMLFFISQNPSLTGKEIAKKIGISTPAVTECLKTLVKEGFVMIDEKKRTNGKFKPFILTEKGMKAVNESEELFTRIDEGIFGNLTESEKRQTISILAKIEKNIEQYGRSLNEE